ncbi:MAG: ChaN family lipoprotein [Marinospirillum sp.]|uniref:ChaN family lipoprotein n=1 Tax=Marinospirillum sp. TaxID=2183934 RepID=UPI0019F2CEB4|nr:ChaN family lipoprotein [Marinospirillum sp.]MBE0505677.1 ChaN family lipoprotein [Marinospirillum sp.]
MRQFIQGLKVLGVGLSILLFGACAMTDTSASSQAQWLASEHQDHPLVGRLWSVAEQRFVEPATFFAELPGNHWLLIGEQHDNPDHQRLTLAWLQALATSNRMGVLALEMARLEQQPLLDAQLGQQVTPEDLNWTQGWPWERYGALVQQGLLQAQQVLATDPSREKQMLAYRDGAPQAALTRAQAEALDALIDQGHCGMLPAERLPAMRQVQLFRDQVMAATLAAVQLQGRVGLMQAGAVHTRRDIGIPRWLPDGMEYSSLWLVQVNQHQQPEEYLAAGVDGIPITDYIYFTPAIPAVDYCEAFKSPSQSSSRR